MELSSKSLIDNNISFKHNSNKKKETLISFLVKNLTCNTHKFIDLCKMIQTLYKNLKDKNYGKQNYTVCR